MTPEEFKEARETLGLTQNGKEGVGRIIGVDDRTVRRYEAGAEIPEPVARLLRLMIAAKISASRARRLLDIKD